VTSFAELYERYAPDVHRFALYLSGDRALADDLTSETFVRAWTSTEPIRLPTVKSYLFAIARNLYVREMRRNSRSDALDLEAPDPGADPERAAGERQELQMVLESLGTMPEIDRSALLLRVVHGMPYEEIAATLGLSLSAAKVKVHRARLKLGAARCS
jgi:RNA polymerase sigma-70 factor (ECF subfamily)